VRLGVGRRAFRFCFFVPAAAARATLILTPAARDLRLGAKWAAFTTLKRLF
jgi:hypothetical protein